MFRQGMLDRLGITQFSARWRATKEILASGPQGIFEMLDRDIRCIISDEISKHVVISFEENIRDLTVDVYGTVFVIKDINQTTKAIKEIIDDAYKRGYIDGSKIIDDGTLSGEWHSD